MYNVVSGWYAIGSAASFVMCYFSIVNYFKSVNVYPDKLFDAICSTINLANTLIYAIVGIWLGYKFLVDILNPMNLF